MHIPLFVVALMFVATGCTTLKPVELDDGQTFAEQIDVGDRVHLILRDGRVRELRVAEVNDRLVTGKGRSGQIETAYWSDVFSVQVASVSAAKTAGKATNGILVAGTLLFVGALLSGSMPYPGIPQ